jgi:hypothetical protein
LVRCWIILSLSHSFEQVKTLTNSDLLTIK